MERLLPIGGLGTEEEHPDQWKLAGLISAKLAELGVQDIMAAPGAIRIIALCQKALDEGVEKAVEKFEQEQFEQEQFEQDLWWITWHSSSKSAKSARRRLLLKFTKAELKKFIDDAHAAKLSGNKRNITFEYK